MKTEEVKIKDENLKKASLFKFVTSYRNIYRAIYSLDSYINELYLLSDKDLRLYYRLQDKYDWKLINKVIKTCRKKIEKILLYPDKYFKTSVFFALKKFEEVENIQNGENIVEGTIKFRPLHTASLKDQICMAAMLQVLMFEDSDEIEEGDENNEKLKNPSRTLSDLSKSIPDNFFGNRVSIKLERIYQKWAPNYHTYNQKIIDSCKTYSKSHKYEYEVSLDIKDFFPSISPFYLFVKICDTLKEKYRNQEKKTFLEIKEEESENKKLGYLYNFEVLKRLVAKLLFLEIKGNNNIMDPALGYYNSTFYDEYKKSRNGESELNQRRLFAKGVAQGLPQSFFFGNICMTDVRREIVSDHMFPGKDYFYVDDSVIYVKKLNKDILKDETFNKKILELNEELNSLTSWDKLKGKWEETVNSLSVNNDLLEDLKQFGGEAVKFHHKYKDLYKIEFHGNSKSKVQTIDSAHKEIQTLGGLGRNISCGDSFFTEGDDRRISKEKMKALNDYACRIIKNIEIKKEERKNKNTEEEAPDSFELQLKVFKRFRKIFLSRNMWLDTLDAGEVKESQFEWFRKLLSPEGLKERCGICSPDELTVNGKYNKYRKDSAQIASTQDFLDVHKKLWFELTDSESFKAETIQLLKCSSENKARILKKEIEEFEENFSGLGEKSFRHLYFHKFLKGVMAERQFSVNRYESLGKAILKEYPSGINIDTDKAIERLKSFIYLEFPFIFAAEERKLNGDENRKGSETLFSEAEEGIKFMKKVSDEFNRRIINAYFSVLVGVDPSEEVPFVKVKGNNIDYAAFRILIWLRNPNFDMIDFWHFLSKIQSHSLPERMIVDNGLPEVGKIFMKKVVDPKKVDNLIMTHRIVKGLWQNGSKFLNSYTLHNQEHALKLINLSVELTRRIDYFQLKQLDFYILFLACYLHDISMVIHPDLQIFSHVEPDNISRMGKYLKDMKNILKEWNQRNTISSGPEWFSYFWKSFGREMIDIFNEVYEFFETDVRVNHFKESALFIKNKRHDIFRYLEETIVEAVAQAGEDHGKEIHHIYDLRSQAKEDVVSSKYISMLLRLADLMDVTNDRINYHLLNENVNHLSENSKFHWISHLITDENTLIPDYEIVEEERQGKEGKKENEFYIKETLRFYLILNMKSLEPIKKEKPNYCGDWQMCKYNSARTPEKFKDFDGITLCFQGKECQEAECTMICRWMNKKHSWMFAELARLQKYLNRVNYNPFKTQIVVNILFKDYTDINLKPSLYDDVRRFLKGEHNE